MTDQFVQVATAHASTEPGRRPSVGALDLPSLYVLMATRDRTGKPLGWHHYGFGGSLLAELAIQGHLEIRHNRLVAGPHPPKDELLRFVWRDIRDVRRPRKARHWVSKLSGGAYRTLRRQFTQRLVDAGVLRHERSRVLWWHRDRYPSLGTGLEAQLRRRIHDAVAAQDASDPRILCLVALLTASEGLTEVARGRDRRVIRKQAKRWMKHEPMAKAVNQIVAEIMAAVIATTVVPAATS